MQDKAVQVEDKTLDEARSITLTKREWILIWNTLLQNQYPLGQAKVLLPALAKLEPIVASLASQDVQAANHVAPSVTATPKDKN